MVDKIAKLLAELVAERGMFNAGLVPVLNVQVNESSLVRTLRDSLPGLELPPIPEKNLEECDPGMTIRWEQDGQPRAAIRTADAWLVTNYYSSCTSATLAGMLVDGDARSIQIIRPAEHFMTPEETLAAICAANDLEVPSPLMDEKPEGDDEDEDEDEDSTPEDGNLTKVFRQMMEALSDGFADDDDEDIELHPNIETSESFRRILRDIPLGSEVSWGGKSWGYRVRKMTSTYWGVVDPDTHDRLDEDEAARWYYFNCGKQSVVDQGDYTGLGSGAINNGQLTRILKRPDVHSVYLHLS